MGDGLREAIEELVTDWEDEVLYAHDAMDKIKALLANPPQDAGEGDERTYCGAEMGEVRDGECECPRCIAKQDAGEGLDEARVAAVLASHEWYAPREQDTYGNDIEVVQCTCSKWAQDANVEDCYEQWQAHLAAAIVADHTP